VPRRNCGVGTPGVKFTRLTLPRFGAGTPPTGADAIGRAIGAAGGCRR
jgi:hypothetical protein